MRRLIILLLVASGGFPSPALSAEPGKAGFVCKAVPPPVVKLDFGSRYKEDSTDRSDFDTESNAEVNRSLKPIDTYIARLSSMANDAKLSDKSRQKRVDCVARWLSTWAKADALSGLDTISSRLAIPGRLAGIAVAYAQVKEVGGLHEEESDVIEAWLAQRIEAMTMFFDQEAPPKASRNNLRAWAGYAATQSGVALGNPAFVDWGRASYELVACQASEDGSLPLEMGRGRLALHYQLHALGPLVLSATLLEGQGIHAFEACGDKLKRIVAFSVAALKDPHMVDRIAGKDQTFSSGDEKLEAHQIAWAEPYLAHIPDPDIETLAEPLRPLTNAKLGGDLTALYPRKTITSEP